jgi:hypothetical protein
VSRRGYPFIDRALYLPKEWTSDSARLKAAHVSSDVGFAMKPEMARQMITRAISDHSRTDINRGEIIFLRRSREDGVRKRFAYGSMVASAPLGLLSRRVPRGSPRRWIHCLT